MYHTDLKNAKGQTGWHKQSVLALQSVTLCQLGAPFISVWLEKRNTLLRCWQKNLEGEKNEDSVYLYLFFQGWYKTWFNSYLAVYLSYYTKRHLGWQLSLLNLVYVNERIQYLLSKSKTAYNQMIERIVGLEEDFWATESSFSHYKQAL